MSSADAEKVIRRRMAKETGDMSPVIAFTPQYRAEGTARIHRGDRQARGAFIARRIFRGSRYSDKDRLDRPLFQLESLKTTAGEALHAIALLEITKDYIELTALMGAQVLFYHK